MDELLNEMRLRGLVTAEQFPYLRNIPASLMLKALVACEIADYYVPLAQAENQIGKLFEFSPNLDHKVAWANPLRAKFEFGRN